MASGMRCIVFESMVFFRVFERSERSGVNKCLRSSFAKLVVAKPMVVPIVTPMIPCSTTKEVKGEVICVCDSSVIFIYNHLTLWCSTVISGVDVYILCIRRLQHLGHRVKDRSDNSTALCGIWLPSFRVVHPCQVGVPSEAVYWKAYSKSMQSTL